MSQCWQEGNWRAYVDGELPAEEMAWGGEHLSQCAECSGRYEEIAGRAVRVSALIADLGVAPVIAKPAAPSRSTWKWAAAAVALAAALAAAFVLAPKRVDVVEAPPIAGNPVTKSPIEAAPVTSASLTRVRPTRVARRKPAQLQYFLAFDEEPIDTGTVMRVSLESGVEADVIVDAGGRPRAIRAVW